MFLVEVEGFLGVYGVVKYCYIFEIEQIVSDLVGMELRVQFMFYLIFMVCGILVIVYVILWDLGLVWDDLIIIYSVFYWVFFFVKILFYGVYF